MITCELLEADNARPAGRAVRENRAADPAKTNYTDVVGHPWRKNFRSFVGRAMVVFMDGETSRSFVIVGRIGYFAKGVIFTCVGLLSAAAGGRASDSRGAIHAIAEQPFGRALLLALIVGLVCYIIWRVLAAIADAENRGRDAKGLALRARSLVVAGIYCSITAAAVKTLMGVSRSGGGGDRSAQDWTATALENPFGSFAVVAIGAAIVIGGAFQCYRAYKEKFAEKLDLASVSAAARQWIVGICAFGLAARGVVFVMAGVLLIQAGFQSNAAKARGLSGSLNALHAQPFGRWIFAVVAAGLAAYGVYCCVKARYGRIGE